MKLYLMRHGEPSYTPCTKRGLIGQGRDLAALNEVGISQMEEAAYKLIKDHADAQVILSSPYTRALQSSAIVAKITGLNTRVVHDLHEWIPDLTFQYGSYKELKLLFEDFKRHKGIRPNEALYTEFTRWEALKDLRTRVRNAILEAAKEYDSVIIMAHGMVLQTLSYQDHYLV